MDNLPQDYTWNLYLINFRHNHLNCYIWHHHFLWELLSLFFLYFRKNNYYMIALSINIITLIINIWFIEKNTFKIIKNKFKGILLYLGLTQQILGRRSYGSTPFIWVWKHFRYICNDLSSRLWIVKATVPLLELP